MTASFSVLRFSIAILSIGEQVFLFAERNHDIFLSHISSKSESAVPKEKQWFIYFSEGGHVDNKIMYFYLIFYTLCTPTVDVWIQDFSATPQEIRTLSQAGLRDKRRTTSHPLQILSLFVITAATNADIPCQCCAPQRALNGTYCDGSIRSLVTDKGPADWFAGRHEIPARCTPPNHPHQ